MTIKFPTSHQSDVISLAKERAWNKLNNYDKGFLFLTQRSQEEHSCSTQRLRSLRQGQTNILAGLFVPNETISIGDTHRYFTPS